MESSIWRWIQYVSRRYKEPWNGESSKKEICNFDNIETNENKSFIDPQRISLVFAKYSYPKTAINVLPSDKSSEMKQTMVNMKDYHYLLNFVDKNPVLVTFVGITVSIRNFFRFIAIFVITKLISYAIYYYAKPSFQKLHLC
eukprot:229715_1